MSSMSEAMTRSTFPWLLAAWLVAGCAFAQPATHPVASTSPAIELSSRGPASPGPQAPTRALARLAPAQGGPVTIYLPRLFEDGSLGLRAVARPATNADEPLRDAIEALIRGPNGGERADDFEYPLDPRTALRSVAVNGGMATIDFESGIDGVYGRPYSELVYWSIVYTATEVPGVDRVTLAYRGSMLREIGEPTLAVPAAAGRADAPDWARPR